MEGKTGFIFLTSPALVQHSTKWRLQEVLTFLIFYLCSQYRERVKKMDAQGRKERCSASLDACRVNHLGYKICSVQSANVG
jgi:hypothetical protein